MEITEGTYRRRDGSIRTISKNNSLYYPWVDGLNMTYSDDGRYAFGCQSEIDLVERIDEVQPDVLTIVNLIAALPEQKRRAVIEIFKE
jgi:hypothetical protein